MLPVTEPLLFSAVAQLQGDAAERRAAAVGVGVGENHRARAGQREARRAVGARR